MKLHYYTQSKWVLFLFCSFQCCIQLTAQQIEMEVVGSAGNNLITDDFDWTLGELMVATFQNSNQVTQGFHQGTLIVSSIYHQENLGFSIEVFPNPFAEYINIKTTTDEDLFYQLYSTKGQLLQSGKLQSNLEEINMAHLYNGTYLLRISRNNQVIKHTQIIKSN